MPKHASMDSGNRGSSMRTSAESKLLAIAAEQNIKTNVHRFIKHFTCWVTYEMIKYWDNTKAFYIIHFEKFQV